MKLWVCGAALGSIGRELADQAINSHKWSEVIGTVPRGEWGVDVTDRRSIMEFLGEHGPFDAVAYCAGVADLRWIEDTMPDDFNNVMNVNVTGFVNVLACMLSRPGPRGKGNVVAITSDAATSPMRGSIAYCSSKAALEMAVRVAARELAPGWRVNGVAPAVVADTKITEYIDASVPEFRGWTPEAAAQYERASIPMGRRCHKEEVAQVMLDILEGPEFLTGSIIKLTGGK